jgi:hypothetical protein
MKDKLIPQSKFHYFLGFTALLIALCAAVFSVYGIGTLFAGASISVMVMASSLEIGKLVSTTFLYRYWTKCSKLLKTYLIVSVLTLMTITSLGIFGYLSSAYQKSSIEFSVSQEKIKNIESQKGFYETQIDSSRKRITELTKLRESQENRMSTVITNEMIARNPLQLKQLQQQTIDLISSTDSDIKSENTKIQNSSDSVQKINEEVNKLKLGVADKKDVQTFKFVADALGVSLDTIARWFIVSIIFVFDPLAICLILAYNVAVYRKEDETVYDKPKEQSKVEPILQPKTLLLDSELPKVEEKQVISEAEPSAPVEQSIVETSSQPKEEPKKVDDHFYNSYFKR